MKGYRTRKISLPGGRVIEIVYFSEAGADSADASADIVQRALENAEDAEVVAGGAGSPPPLHIFPSCASDLVYPVAWEESSGWPQATANRDTTANPTHDIAFRLDMILHSLRWYPPLL